MSIIDTISPVTEPYAATYNVCGVRLSRISIDDVLSIVANSVRDRRKLLCVDQNLHGVYMLGRGGPFAQLHALPETLVKVDGMPLIFFARFFGVPLERRHRVTWLDLIWPLLAECRGRGLRVFFLGGSDVIAEQATDVVARRLPDLQFEAASGYFDKAVDSSANRAVLERLRAYEPNVLLVGMGMGVQEKWLLENLADIEANTIFTVGALFEYLTGSVRTPPRWFGSVGLEWLFRLVENPRRFWFRYLVEPFFVARFLAAGALRRRGFSRDAYAGSTGFEDGSPSG